MTRIRRRGLALASFLVLPLAGTIAAQADTNPCTSPDTGTDPACIAEGTALNMGRQVCDYEYLEGCDITALADPGYAALTNPSPGTPLSFKTGAVHNHSGYSDGDPTALPRDYYAAGRTGMNGNGTGVALDFMFGSEHTDNTQIPITTAAACLAPPANPDSYDQAGLEQAVPPAACAQLGETSHYWKWPATLRQATEGSEIDEAGTYVGFTGVRGFEWTNDYFNHMNVYFSTNYRNVKIDGSYVSMQRMWDWLQTPVAEGGGADGLVAFNHPGGNPALSPFDGGFPHNAAIAEAGHDAHEAGLTGYRSNWNDLEYVPEVDDRVVAMEVRGGDDLEWFVKALDRGWHISPLGAEDVHNQNWSTLNKGKTLILTGGRDPQDYYFAMANRRTVSVRPELLDRAFNRDAIVPHFDFYASGADGRHELGSIVDGNGHELRMTTRGLPAYSRVALISASGGQSDPIALGTTDALGRFTGTQEAADDWYFAVVCPATIALDACGSVSVADDGSTGYTAVTAPIWFNA